MPGTGNVCLPTTDRNVELRADRTALVAFHQQILTLHSQLPLPISHPTVVVIQHYLDLSPTCDEIFGTWQEGDKVCLEGCGNA